MKYGSKENTDRKKKLNFEKTATMLACTYLGVHFGERISSPSVLCRLLDVFHKQGK